MRLLSTTVAVVAIGWAVATPASAQVVRFGAPAVAVDLGNDGYVRPGHDEYEPEDLPRGGRSYYYSNDNSCRVEVTHERYWDGSTYTHRERHCD
ncbi:MAG: hypothetical protein IT538_09630 [Variibacter sp.]|nr:hypothetical protein [Variibacter sp.]